MSFAETPKQTPQTPQRPIIRRGQRTPYAKATRREVQQRLKAVAVLEDSGWETSSIDWFFQEVFGVGPRQTARYRAHTRVREAA
jgi:hypothetical protein